MPKRQKRRPYETLGRRILRLLTLEYGGPRKRNVLRGLCPRDPDRVDRALRRLIDAGMVRMIGDRRGAKYALGKGQ